MTRIIDLRNRPSFLHPFYGGDAPGSAGYVTARWLNRRTGSHDEIHFARSTTREAYLAEIRAARIDKAAVVGRETPGLTISNDAIADLVAGQPSLIGIGSVDPQARGAEGAVAEIERSVVGLGLKGVNIEPGFGQPALLPDDPVFFPVYEAAQALGQPVFLMSGPTTPSLDFARPAALGRVAAQFRGVRFVAYHGYWPFVDEMVGVAFRWDNVFVVPDMYLFAPGGGLYVEAANGFMADQLLFASSYPFRAMKQTVDDVSALGFSDDVLERFFHKNAEQLLGLEP